MVFSGYIQGGLPKMVSMHCKCGNSKVVVKEKDEDYGQYYIYIECEECGWYWEGYYGYIE